jgi:hypothetical protein
MPPPATENKLLYATETELFHTVAYPFLQVIAHFESYFVERASVCRRFEQFLQR